jgi:plasmid stability protein
VTTLALRNVPDELYSRLEEAAQRHKRTVEQEVLALLRGMVGAGEPRGTLSGRPLAEILADLGEFRGRVQLTADTPASAQMLREDRDR